MPTILPRMNSDTCQQGSVARLGERIAFLYHGGMLTVVRRSPIVIVRNFLALQFCGTGLYFLASTVGYYSRIWRGIPLVSDYVPFQVAQGIFIFGAEIGLLLYIFFIWYRDTVRIAQGQLIRDEGILLRRHTAVPLDRIASVSSQHGILGRLANYGTVIIRDRNNAILMRLGSIPEPGEFILLLGGRNGSPGNADPLRLVMEAEHERLERKATLRWDLKARAVNRVLEKSAVKTIAAFLNTDGGSLLIGVADDGGAVGLQHDWATLTRRDADGWENHLGNLMAAMIGPSFRQHVQVRHFEHEGKACALVAVSPSPRPAYVNDEGREEFFIRTGNGTTALKLSEALSYIGSRFS